MNPKEYFCLSLSVSQSVNCKDEQTICSRSRSSVFFNFEPNSPSRFNGLTRYFLLFVPKCKNHSLELIFISAA